jgi:Ca2+-binding EF-hand superfamily protein
MSYSDQQLRDAVDAVFTQFDADKSGHLDANEVGNLINAALKHMNAGRQVSQQEVNQFIKAVDNSGDGKIQKPELFEIFKKVLTQK